MKVWKINEQPIDCKLLNIKDFSKQRELKLENSQDSNKIWEQLIELKHNFTNFEEFKHEETQTTNKLQISSFYSVKTIKVNWNNNSIHILMYLLTRQKSKVWRRKCKEYILTTYVFKHITWTKDTSECICQLNTVDWNI